MGRVLIEVFCMDNNFYENERALEVGQSRETMGRHTAKTFGLMFLGLLVTFAVAIFFTSTYTGLYLLYNAFSLMSSFHLVLLIAQLAVVIGMTAGLQKMSPAAATVCFFVYSALTGLTFTVYFILFDMTSLILVFAATALYFGGMAVFGYFTKANLLGLRPILTGGLIFLIVGNLLMWFIPGLQAADQVMCSIGVIIFLAYTAYDTQKLQHLYESFAGDEVMLKKVSVFMALELYLDFVNLFLYLLRLFGKKKN